MQLSFRYPRLAVALLLIATAVLGAGLSMVEVKVAGDQLYDQTTKEAGFFQTINGLFDIQAYSLVYAETKAGFDRDHREALGAIEDKLNKSKYVKRTHSPISTDVLVRYNGSLKPRPVWTDDIVEHPMTDWYFNDTRTGVMIIVQYREAGAGKNNSARRSLEVTQSIIDEHRDAFDTLFTVGPRYFNHRIAEIIRGELAWVVPSVLLILSLFIYYMIGSLAAVMVPLATSGLSLVWLLGIMGWIGLPINIGTSMVVMIIVAIGSTEDIHLLFEYAKYHRDNTAVDAARLTARSMERVTFLTFATTTVGFGGIYLSGVLVLKQVAISAMIGLSANYLITIVLHPTLTRYASIGGENEDWAVFNFIEHHRYSIVIGCFLVTALLGTGIASVTMRTDIAGYIEREDRAQKRLGKVVRDWGGYHQFYVTLQGPKGYFASKQGLEQIRRTQKQLKKEPYFEQTLSVYDHYRSLNAVLDSPGFSSARIKQYNLLLDIDDFVSPDRSVALIYVRVRKRALKSDKVTGAFDRALSSKRLSGTVRTEPTGVLYLVAQSAQAVNHGQFAALVVLFAAAGIIGGYAYGVYTGLLLVVLNLPPILVFYGLAGHLGIPLDTVSAVFGTIILGIAIDDTLHMVKRYRSTDTLAEAVDTEVRPVVLTTAMLSATFLLFAFVQIPPFRKLSILMPAALLTALIFDLFVMPVLLELGDNWFES